MVNAQHRENRFDFLRLLAAWLVLFSHCYPLSGSATGDPLARSTGLETLGGCGVIAFFVLSGYLVTKSLVRSANPLVFFWHRSLRIYPALVVVCALSILVLGPMFTQLPIEVYFQRPEVWSYWWSASGFDVAYQLPEVFKHVPLANVVNGSLWSLQVEVKCYLAIAVVALLPTAIRYKVLIATAGLLSMFLLRPASMPQHELLFGFDYQHTKLGLVFGLGAVYATWGERIPPLMLPAICLIALALALPAGTALRTACFLVGSATALLWLGLHAMWLPRIPARMGDWSYGLFLYAFPVQQVLAHFDVHRSGLISYLLLSTAIALGLAALSWHLVEKRALVLRRWARADILPATTVHA